MSEWKKRLMTETLKLLGSFEKTVVKPAPIVVSAQCNRVHVNDGHTECLSVKLGRKVTVDQLTGALDRFNPLKGLDLPMSPAKPIVLKTEIDRPQPKLDRDFDKGMAISVGRIRPCPVLDYKFVVMGHNTIRGAAGAAILNAELMKVKGYI